MLAKCVTQSLHIFTFFELFPMVAHHELMDGRLHVYKRDNSRHWQASAFFAGKNHRVTTKEESLSHAKDFAEDWFLELKGKVRRGEVKGGKTFQQQELFIRL